MDAETHSGPDSAEPGASSMSAAFEGLRQRLAGSPTLAAARGISGDALDSMYGVARELCHNGHHAESLVNFQLLCLYDHDSARNWRGLAACRQALQDYAGAAAALAVAIDRLDGQDAGLEINLAECLIASGELEVAELVITRLAASADDGALGEDGMGKVRFLQSRLAELGNER